MSPGRAVAGRSRWQEWVITLSVVALVVVGVAAIWGGSIRQWLQQLGGDTQESAPAPPRGPTGPRL